MRKFMRKKESSTKVKLSKEQQFPLNLQKKTVKKNSNSHHSDYTKDRNLPIIQISSIYHDSKTTRENSYIFLLKLSIKKKSPNYHF